MTRRLGPMQPDIELASGEFWGTDPQDALQWMREHDPVHWDEAGGLWGVSKHADIKTAEQQPEIFSNAGGIRPDAGPTPMMIDMDDPQHAQRRKLVSRGFTPRRVREQEPKIRAVVDRLIDRVCERGQCDFVWDLAAWLPLIMIGDALGVDPDDHPTLLRWSDDLLRGQGQGDPELIANMLDAFTGYEGYISRVIDDRRGCPRDDLMSILVHADVDGDRLDHEALVYESLLILIGGDETTRHVLSGGAYQLLTHPEQWRRLRENRSLLPSAVEEMLRWVSPIKNMARTATREAELGGKEIRAGDVLLMLYPSANRDDAVFEQPFTFDIARSPNPHLAFGFGPHFCLGSSLARLELAVMFDRLLDRLPDLHLAEPDEPAFRPANFVSGYEKMAVAFTPTAPIVEEAARS